MKKKINRYVILAILCYIGMVVIPIIYENKIISIVLSIVLFLTLCYLIYKTINKYVDEDDEFKIAESDERNILIRGKASESTKMVTTFIFTTILIVFSVLEYWVPAAIMAVGILLNNVVFFCFFSIYEKKH